MNVLLRIRLPTQQKQFYFKEEQMQFSIARLLLITLFVNFVVAATFAFPPIVGILLLTFVAMFVVPPFILVGVVNQRGIQQSFFLGAMITGIPHFIVTAYFFVVCVISGFDGIDLGDLDELADYGYRYVHAIGFLIGTIGGISGMASYWFLSFGKQRNSKDNTELGLDDDESKRPEIFPPASDEAKLNDLVSPR